MFTFCEVKLIFVCSSEKNQPVPAADSRYAMQSHIGDDFSEPNFYAVLVLEVLIRSVC